MEGFVESKRKEALLTVVVTLQNADSLFKGQKALKKEKENMK